MPRLTRRQSLAAGASLPLATFAPTLARAEAPMLGAGLAPYRRIPLGAFEVTTLLVNTMVVPDPQSIFGMNVSATAFAEASTENFLSPDESRFFFTPTVVNTGAELVLFDTGQSAEGTTAALAAAGYTPEQIDIVVLTHMHGDHIGGMQTGGAPTFANARYVTGRVEYDAWAAAGDEGFNTNVRPFADRMTFLDDGQDAASGITALAAFGHTPGHMTYRLESEGAGLLIFADLANHPVWSLARPDWEVRFDMDKAAAAASRRAVLGMLAAERLPAIGYHMPFPALGFVDTRDGGFQWVPEAGQLMG
ncbi:MBL fold metallo-hydrolase [Rhodophyticola porphyridii]|uniref:MBL fold metallo-hydrolase n=1 Tax=Rhodophyticola porphyridii TaxID=1852017 RepID=A0A3L9Y4L7_9RHOB|nr:MBL fold metallo-hydrolase [Rhodophyticola porphyridii]RMA43764.1 MBL fold metallo-hydrolase [Rhodophyticola porphyridii]